MRTVVFGLGHVGIVTMAGLIRDGHVVVGVDTNQAICDCVARGVSPFREPSVAGLIATGHVTGRLSASSRFSDVGSADVAFVCVGSPGLPDGPLDVSDVMVVARQFGEAVRQRSPELSPMLLVFRTTIPPGSMNKTILPAIVAAAGESPGTRYEVAYSPAFMREGSAVADYFAPGRIIIGERRPGSARTLLDLFSGIEAPIFTTSFEVAELTKFADNAFHALKVTFANEIGRFARQSNIAPAEVFDLFLADTKLNLSASYLQPGGPFGGPCLPKDVRALATCMRAVGIAAPIIDHVLESNSLHADYLIAEIERRTTPHSRILLVGLSFKTGSDDIRGSPFVRLAEALLDRGHELSIYDPDFTVDETVGVRAQLPSRLSAAIISQLSAEVAWDLVVMAKAAPEVLRSIGADCSLFQIDRL